MSNLIITAEEYKAMSSQKKPGKFRNVRVEVDGIKFASKKEARHYGTLKLLADSGKIQNLRLQVRYSLDVNGVHIAVYVLDFQFEENGKTRYQDTKGYRPNTSDQTFKLKKRLMLACHGIEVEEI